MLRRRGPQSSLSKIRIGTRNTGSCQIACRNRLKTITSTAQAASTVAVAMATRVAMCRGAGLGPNSRSHASNVHVYVASSVPYPLTTNPHAATCDLYSTSQQDISQ